MRWWIPGRATRSREAAPGELAPGPGCGARRRRPRPPLHRRSPNRSPRTGSGAGRDSRRRRRPGGCGGRRRGPRRLRLRPRQVLLHGRRHCVWVQGKVKGLGSTRMGHCLLLPYSKLSVYEDFCAKAHVNR